MARARRGRGRPAAGPGSPRSCGRRRGPASGRRTPWRNSFARRLPAHRPTRPAARQALVDVLEVDDEDERLAAGDVGRAALRPVAEVGGDDQLAPPALLHADEALVPALDDLAAAERELEGGAGTVPRRVELLAGRERLADVGDRQRVALLGRGALADDEVLDDELGRRVARGLGDLGLVLEVGRVADRDRLARERLRRIVAPGRLGGGARGGL